MSQKVEQAIPISIFTPSRTDPKVLEAIFVQRETLLKEAIERVEHSATTKNKHHQLVVGSRGSGKTHLVTLLVNRLKNKNALKNKLRIAWLNEDETYLSLLDILLNIYDALHKAYPDEYSIADKDKAFDMGKEEAENFLGELLIQKINASKTTCLVVIENLDELFSAIGDIGQKRLRAYLQENPVFSIFATAQKLTDNLSNRNDPFFGFFQTEHLKPLTQKQAATLVGKIARLNHKKDVEKFLKTPQGKARIKALHHLSGGNHRIYIVLSQFISKDSIDALVQPFLKMVDELTPYYQERLRWLPPQQRKIIELLSANVHTMSVKAIAKRLFSSNQTIASQLKDLKQKGYVHSHKRGRESLYEISEPLMRICVEVKENQSNQPIGVLVEFIRSWYAREEIENKLHHTETTELGQQYLQAALEQNALELIDKESELNPMVELVMKGINLVENGDFDKALSNLTRVIESSNVPALLSFYSTYIRGLVYDERDDFNKALQDYTFITELPDVPIEKLANVLINRGVIYGKIGKFEQALSDFSRVTELPNVSVEQLSSALFNRGVSYGKLEKVDKALLDYAHITELPDVPIEELANALINRGVIYENRGDSDKSLLDFTRVIESKNLPTELLGRSLNNRGIAYLQRDELDKSLSDFEKVVHNKQFHGSEFHIFAAEKIAEIYLSKGQWIDSTKYISECLRIEKFENSSTIYNAAGVITVMFESVSTHDLRVSRVSELVLLFAIKNNALAAGLVSHLGQLHTKEPQPSKDNLNSWLMAWQQATLNIKELDVPMRLFTTGMTFLMSEDKDEEILLDLIGSEREILKQAFSLSE